MSDDTRTRFDAGAAAWSSYNQQPLGRIRHEVTWHNLAPYLPCVPDKEHRPRVLDAGGGSGELAQRLVRSGYRVWLLDYAPAMLDQARLAASSLDAAARARLVLQTMAVEDAFRMFSPGYFDVIVCHTLIEYLTDPAAALDSLIDLLCEGGLMSVSFVSRHSEVLRQVWSRADPGGALNKLQQAVSPSSFCASLFDLPGRAFAAEEVAGWLAGAGLSVAAVCGIRVFADFLPKVRLLEPGYFDALLRLEISAATREPYKGLARYHHLIARKTQVPEGPAQVGRYPPRRDTDPTCEKTGR